jgi:hypothetical protein
MAIVRKTFKKSTFNVFFSSFFMKQTIPNIIYYVFDLSNKSVCY